MTKHFISRVLNFALNPPAVWAAFTSPRFSLTAYHMARSLSEQGIRPRTVLDVGANVGQSAAMLARFFPSATIHSFEPLPECAPKLNDLAKKIPRLKVYNYALGDSSGEVEFKVNAHSHSSSVLSLAGNHSEAFPDAREIKTIRVPVTTLDFIAESLTLDTPVLLKLDVQGFEAVVLKGAQKTLQRVHWVILECSFKEMYKGEKLFLEIVDLMQGYGFTFLRPISWLSDEHTGEILQADALFVRGAS